MPQYTLFVAAFFLYCVFFSGGAGAFVCNKTLGTNDTQDGIIFPYAKKGEEVCMRGLGCFTFTADFFHPLYRPFNFLPNDRSIINTQFHLFTRRNPKEYVTLIADDPSSIKESPLNRSVPTKFIVHGFIDNRLYAKWMEELKDNLLLQEEYNVFIVDWSGGNSPPYTKATANTRVVGAEIALMIRTLSKVKGVSPMDCHIIGHSLGSHIAGYAGKYLKKVKLGRISAVDPAEPFYQYMPATVRVDRTDADFVDVIHTDTQSILLLGLGMSQAVGHVDFYPNEGKHQPGCKTDVIRSIFLEGLIDATRRFVACNHQRAVDFFTHSINYRKATPVGYHCRSWKEYIAGHCSDCGRNGDKCAILGLRADEYRPLKNDSRSLVLYLSTSGTAPYWIFQYHVTVKLSKPKRKFADQEGKLSIIIHGQHKTLALELTPKAIRLHHGGSYKFLVQANDNPGPIRAVSFSWANSSWNIFKTKELYVEFLKVVSMNNVEKGKRKECTVTFTDKPDKAIKSGSYVSLSPLCRTKESEN